MEARTGNLGGIQRHCPSLSFLYGIRKDKAPKELNFTRYAKSNKKGFYKYTGNKRKTRENVALLLSETGSLVTQDTKKVEVLNAAFASSFTSKTGFQEYQAPEIRGKGWSKEDVPLVQQDQVREYLKQSGHT